LSSSSCPFRSPARARDSSTSCLAPLVAVLVAVLGGCETGGGGGDAGTDGGRSPFVDGSFVCIDEDVRECVDNVHLSCEQNGEFLSTVRDDCDDRQDGRNICVRELGCSLCRPNSVFCADNDVVRCDAEGGIFAVEEECDLDAGFVCRNAQCVNLCEEALNQRSYEGCEFYGVDLDNAAIRAGSDASSQQFSIVVSNPRGQSNTIVVERNNAPFGEEPDLEVIEEVTLLPGDLEILELPRREIDGSSSFGPCDASAMCGAGEQCYCAGGLTIEDPEPMGGHRDCRCRIRAGSNGLNDGTHSALSSNAYRVRSTLPIVAYQFNPLDNVGVFSNDASLLLPTSAVGPEYTVVGWPQTIAHSTNPNEDFDRSRDDEDLRAFLTVVGTRPDTHVTIRFADDVRRVVGVGGFEDALGGETWDFDIGPFDVLNLETQGFNADFSGSTITACPSPGPCASADASRPVSVFVGTEASDAPRFGLLANRQCCADHLEEQLFPRDTLGTRFFIGRMPPRSVALNRAFLDPTRDSVGEFDEPEFVRIHAVEEGTTTITTSLPPPRDTFTLERDGVRCPDDGRGSGCRSVILIADQDFEINADRAVAVLQVLPSQEAVGIDNRYPGGDPALIAVPPVEQFRREYVFLTPELYAFDFVTITARAGDSLLLDERPIQEWVEGIDGMGECDVAPADGLERRMGDPPPEWLVYRCQFSFPDVVGLPNVNVQEGIQNDGVHTLRASSEDGAGIVVYGFDAFVSYAYAGGLNLDIIQ
jgi:hypothetical protein